jgi:hypothetical protein
MKGLLVVAGLLLGAAPAHARDDSSTIEAIWLRQVVNFVYQADTTFYTCSSLRQKIAGMLSYVGARAAGPLRGVRCDDFAGTVRMQIAFESPAAATAENVRAMTDHDTEDLLVARLRGERLATPEDITRFPAAWATRSLRESGMELTGADCELVQQLRRQVLPKLAVEVIKEPSRCTSVLSRSSAMPNMKVRALLVAG